MFADFTGLVLGERYEIQDLLGSGGVALVFNAHDRTLDRQMAVKIVKPDLDLSSEVADRFVREARIIANLEHPHILSVYDQGRQLVESQTLAYLVMQLAVGGTLADQLGGGALTPDEASRILKQVCDALDYAHQREVLHLDVKPLNILFDEHGNALVADFGLARLLEGASRVKADTGFGTPIYMAPEQYFGQKAGPFSDVYALGVTLYQMLTGDLPEHNWSDLSHFLRLDHPLPSGIRPVIEKATHPVPDQRYRTAGELERAFKAAIAVSPRDWETEKVEGKPVPALEGVEEHPATRKSPLLKRESSMLWVVIGLVALVIVASLGILGALQRRWERRAEATLAAISLILTSSPKGNAMPTVTSSPSAVPHLPPAPR